MTLQSSPRAAGNAVRRLFLFAAAVSLTACASLQEIGKTPEEIVAMRAASRWNAIIAGEWETAYSYATSGYRGAVDLKGFIGRTSGMANRKSVDIRSVKCEASSCEVVVGMTYVPAQPGFGELTTEFSERWVEEEGRWFVHLRL